MEMEQSAHHMSLDFQVVLSLCLLDGWANFVDGWLWRKASRTHSAGKLPVKSRAVLRSHFIVMFAEGIKMAKPGVQVEMACVSVVYIA